MPASPAALPPFFWPPAEGEAPSDRPPSDWQLVGHDYGTFLVVRKDGSVASMDPSARLPERFVNSSRDQFLDSLELLRAAWAVRAELSEADAVQQARELRKGVAVRDEAALRSEDHWWSTVLEQLEDGML